MDSQGRVVSCVRSVTPHRYAERNKEDLIYYPQTPPLIFIFKYGKLMRKKQ